MHPDACQRVSPETVKLHLLDDIAKFKSVTAEASAAGARVHTLPTRPKDIEDDGAFHYAILGPNAASESGNPTSKARQFLR